MEISKMGSNVTLSLFEDVGLLSILREPIGMLKRMQRARRWLFCAKPSIQGPAQGRFEAAHHSAELIAGRLISPWHKYKGPNAPY